MATPFDPNQQSQQYTQPPGYQGYQGWHQPAPQLQHRSPKKSIFRQWWLWAGVALALVVGLVVGLSFVGDGEREITAPAATSSSSEPSRPVPSYSPPAPRSTYTPPPPVTPPTNERGNLVKQPGEEGGVYALSDPDTTVASWTVTNIDTNLTCTEEYHSDPAENGHLVGVELEFETGPTFTTEVSSYASIASYDFSFIDSSGITHTELGTMATYGCISDSAEFTRDTLGAGQRYVGTIVLDLPEVEGALVFAPSWGPTDLAGWEYPVG